MNQGRFRKQKQKPFTQVSNAALRDKNLSLKAKGLYAQITMYLSIPDFTLYKSALNNTSSDGETSFNTAFNELKKAGYLKIYKMQTPNGFVYEYELLDEPDTNEAQPSPGKTTSGEPKDGKPQPINNKEKNNKEEKERVNNNDVVKTDIYLFISKVSAYVEDLSKIYPDQEIVFSAAKKLYSLLKSITGTIAQKINDFTNEQAVDLFKTAFDIYYDDGSYPRRDPILNPDAYLIGILKNKL